MGNRQSTSSTSSQETPSREGIVFYNDNAQVPIKFSQTLVSNLGSNRREEKSPKPQDLEKQLQNRVISELKRLKAQEDQILHEIENRLEKENIDKTYSDKTSLSSITLEKEIEKVEEKVKRLHSRRDIQVEIEPFRNSLIMCFKDNQNRPLNCWKQVEEFKNNVASLETDYVKSLS